MAARTLDPWADVLVPDTLEGHAVAMRREIEQLQRELALVELYVEQLQRQLIAAGALDPELGP